MNRAPLLKKLCIFAISSAFLLPLATSAVTDKEIDTKQTKLNSLQSSIQKKKTEYQSLQDKVTTYKESLKARQQESLTLKSQLEVLDENLGLTETEIEQTTTKIEELDDEIEKLQIQIADTQRDVNDKQGQIGSLITDLYEYDEKTYLEVALSNDTLSEFSSQIEYTEDVNTEFKNTLDKLQDLKQQLQEKKTELDTTRDDQKTKKIELTSQKDSLKGQAVAKENLLDDVQEDEEKFQQLVKELQAEQAEVNANISGLEKNARQTLDELSSLKGTNTPDGEQTSDTPGQNITLPTDFNPIWPVNGTVTTTFHDPSYIYRRYFEHDAIDIAAPQGTPLKAADSGVVAVVKYDGTAAYSYVMIVHADNFATIYGHVSQVYVQPDEVVEQGQTIAAVGGYPGTPGSGGFTTGSHVHFGVRLNGIPVDPMLYLP